jgi:hypothetical protein
MRHPSRSCPGAFVDHVKNRATGRLRLCKTDADHLALEPIMTEAQQRHSLTILDCGGMTVAFKQSYLRFIPPDELYFENSSLEVMFDSDDKDRPLAHVPGQLNLQYSVP